MPDALLGTAAANDNCPGVVVARSGVPAGNVFSVGQTTVTYEARNASGNVATAHQVVTVTDNTAPSIIAPPGVTVASATIPVPSGKSQMINKRGEPKDRPVPAGDVTTGEPEFVPTSYVLAQNFPDPFNPTTTLQFDLPEPAAVTLEVFDVAGRRVSVVMSRKQFAIGRHRVVFDGQNLATGLHFYRIQANEFVSTKKMLLMK